MATLAQPMKATLWSSTMTYSTGATTTAATTATVKLATTLLPLLTRTAYTEPLRLSLMRTSK